MRQPLVLVSRLLPLLAAAAFIPPPGLAQTASSERVHWVPEHPVQGSLIRLEVRLPLADTVALEGVMAGEPLHFESDGAGRAVALGAIPLETRDSIAVTLMPNGGDSIRLFIPVAAAKFRSERLTVAPKFGHPPDSATAKRIAEENALARSVALTAHRTPRLWRSPFVPPRSSRITDTYGHARVYNGRVESRHYGTDFSGAVGAPVVASGNGVVALVADFYLAGKVLYIDHGAGLVSGYFHLSEVSVTPGDTVHAGQAVAKVGKSGRVTGSHLHWSLRYGAITVDPMSLLRLEGK